MHTGSGYVRVCIVVQYIAVVHPPPPGVFKQAKEKMDGVNICNDSLWRSSLDKSIARAGFEGGVCSGALIKSKTLKCMWFT